MSNNDGQFQNFHDEIIGVPPNNITQYGISIIFVFVLILMFFAWKIDYSDTIVSRTIINSKNPTVSVVAKYNDVVKQLFIKNGEYINIDDNIVLMKSDISLSTVKQIKQFLSNQKITGVEYLHFHHRAMGSFRDDFQVLIQNIHKYNSLTTNAIDLLKKEQLMNENLSFQKQLKELYNQNKLSSDKEKLFKKEHQRSLELSKRSLITHDILENSKSKFIDSKISSNRIQREISQVESLIDQNSKQIDLLLVENKELLIETNNQIESKKHILIDQLNSWEKRHLIKAPISGIISIPNSIYTHKNITDQQELFSIIPESKSLIGKIKIPEKGSGKIHIGQSVIVKLDSFPYQEFGKIIGEVKSKSVSIHESSVFIEITIKKFNSANNKLTTSYGKEVRYFPNMQGTVEIITNKKNVLSRIFKNLLSNI